MPSKYSRLDNFMLEMKHFLKFLLLVLLQSKNERKIFLAQRFRIIHGCWEYVLCL